MGRFWSRQWAPHLHEHVLAFNDLHLALAVARGGEPKLATMLRESLDAYAREGEGDNALVTAQRKYGTAQQSSQQAQRFLDITQQQERLGQVARSDVVKAQIQYEQQRQTFQEAMLGIENSRLNLAVLLFPQLNENFQRA